MQNIGHRRSPVLFPVVGALKGGSFLYEGKSYAMGQHGFARNMEFQLIERSAHSCTYELLHNDETKTAYPFEFALRISYNLIDNKLEVRFEVENLGAEDLYYSIGAHPAFNCPMLKGQQRSDYRLVFGKKESLSRQLIDKGIRTGEWVEVLADDDSIEITDDLFDQDALIFNKPASTEITLMLGDKAYLKMNFQDFDYLGIWSKSNTSPFVCLEPWMGVADHVGHNQNLPEKEGIRKLSAGRHESFAYTLEMMG